MLHILETHSSRCAIDPQRGEGMQKKSESRGNEVVPQERKWQISRTVWRRDGAVCTNIINSQKDRCRWCYSKFWWLFCSGQDSKRFLLPKMLSIKAWDRVVILRPAHKEGSQPAISFHPASKFNPKLYGKDPRSGDLIWTDRKIELWLLIYKVSSEKKNAEDVVCRCSKRERKREDGGGGTWGGNCWTAV